MTDDYTRGLSPEEKAEIMKRATYALEAFVAIQKRIDEEFPELWKDTTKEIRDKMEGYVKDDRLLEVLMVRFLEDTMDAYQTATEKILSGAIKLATLHPALGRAMLDLWRVLMAQSFGVGDKAINLLEQ